MRFKKFKFTSLLFICSLVSCSSNIHSETMYPFSTYLTMTFYNENLDTTEIKELVNKYDKLADPYNSYEGINNVCTINNSDDFVLVSDELLDLLKSSVNMKQETNGYFNPLIGNLSLLWKTAIENKALPSEILINEYLEEINNSSIIFDGNKVKIQGNANIDLGAITKGYVLNKINEYLYNNSIKNYLINAGNSSILLGSKNGSDFKIGINSLSMGFKAKETSIGTSSVDEQNFALNSVTYSHIINPFTGGAVAKHETVVVMGDDATSMDVYSTVFMMNTLEEIKKISMDKAFKIIVIDDKNIVYHSDGIELYV